MGIIFMRSRSCDQDRQQTTDHAKESAPKHIIKKMDASDDTEKSKAETADKQYQSGDKRKGCPEYAD